MTLRTLSLLVLTTGAAALTPAEAADTAGAQFIDAQGEQIGRATLTATPAGVLIDVDVRGLAPGEHGFHIHEKGVCEGDFKSAGGHYDPRGVEHGYLAGGADATHAGDMPNQFVQEDGVLRAHVLNTGITLDDGELGVLDQDGSAIIVHGGADDYRSQPSGDAGARVACAVIETKS